MYIIKNTTDGIHPFQQALYNKITQGGFKHGEMSIISAGRRTGKSNIGMYMTMLKSRIYDTNLCKEIIFPGFDQACGTSSKQQKKVKQYKFSRAKWYEAKLHKDGQAAYNWCIEQFGSEPTYPDAWSRWYYNVNRTFRFCNAEDYEWFMMRWGA